jgi:hypothetical protein
LKVSSVEAMNPFYSPTKEDDDGVALGGDEPEHEDVLAAAVVACRSAGEAGDEMP